MSAARGGGLIREGWQDSVEGVWRPLTFIKVMAYVFVKVHLPSRVKPERGNMLFLFFKTKLGIPLRRYTVSEHPDTVHTAENDV